MSGKSGRKSAAPAVAEPPKTAKLDVAPETPVAAAKTPVQVHRCRFVDYTPVAITSVAFNAGGTGLVVGRSDASLEYWKPLPVRGKGAKDLRGWSAVAVSVTPSSVDFARTAVGNAEFYYVHFTTFMMHMMSKFIGL